MVDLEDRAPESYRDPGGVPGAGEIEKLVASLGDRDYLAHPAARQALVDMGRPALGPLISAVSSPNEHLRWEATKALGIMGDPAAAPALVQALDDERFGVRWLAAEGLVRMGRAALPALLQALERHADSPWLRESAHHVLRLLSEDGHHGLVAPVLAALDDMEPALGVPIAARRVLDELERREGRGR